MEKLKQEQSEKFGEQDRALGAAVRHAGLWEEVAARVAVRAKLKRGRGSLDGFGW